MVIQYSNFNFFKPGPVLINIMICVVQCQPSSNIVGCEIFESSSGNAVSSYLKLIKWHTWNEIQQNKGKETFNCGAPCCLNLGLCTF